MTGYWSVKMVVSFQTLARGKREVGRFREYVKSNLPPRWHGTCIGCGIKEFIPLLVGVAAEAERWKGKHEIQFRSVTGKFLDKIIALGQLIQRHLCCCGAKEMATYVNLVGLRAKQPKYETMGWWFVAVQHGGARETCSARRREQGSRWLFVVVQDEKQEEDRRQPAVDEITNDFGPMEFQKRRRLPPQGLKEVWRAWRAWRACTVM
ncbi:hypothetical protein QBC32DRAFT_381919 [Pseudoneurospora amorphoporcata]|uniref:Uncharacterized protein n=1 Tax=Pseudoneurospora amorphoporcata TaxID=241081 RepID=A0AAN6NZI8_9PEZI|nr:hypothetical protein QBC32DRAFT_381919 [Pseudoneurospora amorphoporcata]